MNKEIIKRYDKIVYELLLVMLVTEVYLIICRQWIFAITFGILLIGSYIITKKEIKEIKKKL